LSQERVAVVGVGNVAIDVARILCRTPIELVETDIVDYALEALSNSNIKEVHLLGRRGPAQAAFTNPEVKELDELMGADVITLPEEMELDPLSRQALEHNPEQTTIKKIEILKAFASRVPTGKPRKLIIRFLVSPEEFIGDEMGHVTAVRLVKNELYATEAGTLRPRPTNEFEVLPVGLVFRSVGYRGVPLSGVPFNEKWGVIINQDGRVIDPDTQQPIRGQYTAGWIKRGPSGVIGTNKPDAAETAECMLEDVKQGVVLQPLQPEVAAAENLVRKRQPNYFTYGDWLRLNELEIARGRAAGRPRLKFTCMEEMREAVKEGFDF
jgi:ferredoxin--NADP+ reductase